MGQHPHCPAGRIGTLSRRPHGRGPAAPGTGGVMTIAADLARALDPVLLAEQAGLVPDPWQAQVLRSTAARVPNDLYGALRPMLAVSKGRLIALSTPHGTRGWFYDAWRSQESWERYEVAAPSCPRISAAFLDEEKRSMGDWWFTQEYMCT